MGKKITPHYWEAWHVDGSGYVIPETEGVNDGWIREAHTDTSGNWSIDAKVYWAADLSDDFMINNSRVPEARGLETTTKPQTNLGTSLLIRHAAASWNC